MPYVLVKYEEVRHRCTVGDAGSDPELMKILDAEVRQSGDAWKFVSLLAPRLVLNKLETQGYRVITCTSKGDDKHEGFILWTLHKEEGDGPPDYDRLTEYTGGKSAASSRSAQKWVWKHVLCYFLILNGILSGTIFHLTVFFQFSILSIVMWFTIALFDWFFDLSLWVFKWSCAVLCGQLTGWFIDFSINFRLFTARVVCRSNRSNRS